MTRIARDEAEFREFVARESPKLLRAAYLLLHDRDAAEDVTQTALLRTFRRWSRARTAPEAYTHRVLINVCHNHWRHQRRHPVDASIDNHEPDVTGPGESDRADQRLMLEDALAGLSTQQRAVLVARFLLDLSVSETAQLLRIPEGTVKSTTHRGLHALRELLADDTQEVHIAH